MLYTDGNRNKDPWPDIKQSSEFPAENEEGGWSETESYRKPTDSSSWRGQ